MDDIISLLKSEVNVHGELHLDAVKTGALMRFLKTVSLTLNGYDTAAKQLLALSDDIKKLAGE